MRRSVVLSALFALLLGLVPAAVQAAPATRIEEHAVVVQCDTATDDGFVSMTVAISDEFGSFGDLAFWEAGTEPFVEAPTWVASSASVTGDATGLTASFELVEFDETQDPPFGDPAGTALLTVDLSPEGDLVDIQDRFRNGNRWERVTGTIQPLALDGSLELPGADLATLESCFASEQNLTYFSTSPSAYTDRFREFVGSCLWEDGTDTVGVFVRGDAFGAFGDVFISGPEMEVSGTTDVTVGDGDVSFEVELFDFETGDVVGSATVNATFAPTGEFFRTVETFGIDRVKIRGEAFTVDGTLEVTLDGTTTAYPINDEHCDAADQVVSIQAVIPAGPKPGPLANDAPEDATALRLGRLARVVTGGNAVEAEAPCSAEYPDSEGPVEVPFGYTAWWTVTGTGEEMTVDTAGSTFDTVVAVYTLENGVFEQVVCVDDVFDEDFSLQARATWASEAGVTYYIQAGGFDTSAGRLQLVVN